jgi:hypothetical protein
MWTILCVGLIWAVGLVVLLLFFAGAKREPEWDGLHHREGEE